MRHDDLRIDCPRKGNRDDGNPACLACPSHAHSDGKARPLLCPFLYRPFHPIIDCVRAA